MNNDFSGRWDTLNEDLDSYLDDTKQYAEEVFKSSTETAIGAGEYHCT